jgi:putative transposase
MAHRRWYATDLTDREWALLAPCYHRPSRVGGPAQPICVRCSTPSAIGCAAAGRGICCRTTFRPGRRCTPPGAPGASAGIGSGSTRSCASGAASALAANRRPAPASSTANPSRRRKGGPAGSHGYDGGKKLSGRKRHLLVDTGGLVVKALVHAADITDRQGGQQLLEAIDDLAMTFPRLCYLWVDSAYQGSFKDWGSRRCTGRPMSSSAPPSGCGSVWVKADQEPPPAPTGFQVLRRRGVGERTFGW